MKIDLHIHTIRTKEDSCNRNISPNEFVEKMKESNVGIAGITNHNYFCKEQFDEIIRLAGNDLLVLPGVELTVFVNENKNIKHMNLILNNDENSILKLQTFLENNKVSSNTPIDIKEVINFFDDEEGKVIFYLDKKSSTKERGFSDDEIKKFFFHNDKFKNVFVLDTNVKGYSHYFRNGITSLIGSDVKNWNNYVKDSNKLINYYTPIFSFEILYRIFKNGDAYDNFRRDDLLREINDIHLTDKCTLKKVPIIAKSVNIIFGSKATGKTTLLEKLYNGLDVDASRKKLYEKVKDFELLAKSSSNYNNCYYEYKCIKNNICSKIREILDYDELLEKNYLHELYLYCKDIERNQGKFNIISVQDNKKIEEPNVNKIIIEIINNLKKSISVNYLENDVLYRKTTNIVNELIEEWKKEYLKINNEYFQSRFIYKTISKLQNIIKMNKNILPKVTELGLWETFEKRSSLNKKIKNLNEIVYGSTNKNIKTSDKKINLKTFEFNNEYIVPIENSVNKRTWYVIRNIFLNIKQNNNDKNYTLKKIINHLLSRDYEKDYSDPSSLINKDNMSSILELLNDENSGIFKDEYKLVLKDNVDQNKKPSIGEESYIFLKNFLNEDVDWFFIDEPEEHLNSQFISEVLLSDIEQLIKNGKTIIITTHNNILGLNTNPSNYLLRENIEVDNGIFSTWYGNMASKNMIPLFDNTEREIDITTILLKYFEGNKDLYIYRSNIYEIERDKNGK